MSVISDFGSKLWHLEKFIISLAFIFCLQIMTANAEEAETDYHSTTSPYNLSLAELLKITVSGKYANDAMTLGATGTPQRLSDVAINMTIVSDKEISASGARNIPEILRRYVGIDVQRIGGTAYNVDIRGQNRGGADRIRVIINGRDTYRTYSGTTLWNTLSIPLSDIRQIEIIRGPATALYGPNAVSGVINIITHNPFYDDIRNIELETGNIGSRRASGSYTYKFGKIGAIRVSAEKYKADRFDAVMTEKEPELLQSPDDQALNIDSVFNISEDTSARLELNFKESRAVTQIFIQTANGSVFEDHSAKVSLNSNTPIGVIEVRAYKNEMKEGQFWDSQGPFGVITRDAKASTTALEIDDLFELGPKNVFRVSAGYKEDKVNQFNHSAAVDTGDIGYDAYNIGGMWNWKANTRWSLANSIRYDTLKPFRTADELFPYVPYKNSDYDYTLDAISGNMAALYKLGSDHRLRFVLSRGIDTPSTFELGADLFCAAPDSPLVGVLNCVGGNPYVKEAAIHEAQVIYEKAWALKLLSNSRLTLFAQKTSDIQAQYYQGAPEIPATAAGNNQATFSPTGNIDDTQTIGLELELNGDLNNLWNWGVGYSFAHALDSLAPKGDVVYLGQGELGENQVETVRQKEFFEKRSSEHIANLLLGYKKERVQFNGILQYKSEFDSYTNWFESPVSVDDLFVLNLSASYHINNFEISATGEGLLDKTSREVSVESLNSERTLFLTLGYRF